MAYDYSKKVIVITGGAGGIGSHLAREFSAKGAQLVLLDINQGRLDAVVFEENSKVVQFTLPPSKAGVKLVQPDNMDELVRLLHEEAKVI